MGEGDDYPEDSTPNKSKEKYIVLSGELHSNMVNVSYVWSVRGFWVILGRAVDSGSSSGPGVKGLN